MILSSCFGSTGATSLGGFGYNTQSTGGATGLFGKTATPQTVQSGSSGFGQGMYIWKVWILASLLMALKLDGKN